MESSHNELEPWGINAFDSEFVGLPKLTFNLLRTCNLQTNNSAIGHFLKSGIELDQRVALIGFEHPNYMLANFKEAGFCFDNELLSQQLIYLYYKPLFSYSLCYVTDYRKLFDEILLLANGDISRIAFLNADVLFNLETHLLAEASVQHIISAFSSAGNTILGCYQASDTPSHLSLDQISKECLSSYLEIRPATNGNDRSYELRLHKFPLADQKENIELHLTPGYGFNTPKMNLIQHG